jgi:phage/plasmid-like protein (TIGR03299 family)
MLSLLDLIIDNASSPANVVSENHNFDPDSCASLAVTDAGKVMLMTAGELPWHKLGVNVDKACTSAEAIRFASLDWRVMKLAAHYDWQGKKIESKETFVIVREDTGKQLGTVGSRYVPIQNVDGFSFLDGVLEEYGARYETAGALYAGEKVFMLAHFPKQAFTINGGDRQEAYVAFTTTHDGSGAAACFPTSVRIVCRNTFRLAQMNKGKGISIRHTGNIKEKVREARKALGFAVQEIEEYKTAAEALYHKPCEIHHYANDVLDAVLEVTHAEAMKGADALAAALKVTETQRELAAKSFERKIERREEILADILDRYEKETNGIAGIRGTAWACFNAVTEHADHAKQGRESSDLDTKLSRRFESIINGQADDMKQAAFQTAMAV